MQCPAPGTLAAEPPPRQVALDGGVPLDNYVYALAVARCDFLSRHFALSTYAANNCVYQVTTYNSYGYPPAGGTGVYDHPSEALLQAAAVGVVRYDPEQASRCMAALLAEGRACGGLIEELPDCVGVFSCPPGADGGLRPADGGVVDGGPRCSDLVAPFNDPYKTCTTDDDCVDVHRTNQGPICVAGLCAPTPCGIFSSKDTCTPYAAAGEPCRSNALSSFNPVVGKDMCAPGLACQGRKAGNGVGTCVVPVDVGEACTDNDNCKIGLTCACGTCAIPPASGPCVNQLCETGVAYCDPTNLCRPVVALGERCERHERYEECGPSLFCDSHVCRPIGRGTSP